MESTSFIVHASRSAGERNERLWCRFPNTRQKNVCSAEDEDGTYRLQTQAFADLESLNSAVRAKCITIPYTYGKHAHQPTKNNSRSLQRACFSSHLRARAELNPLTAMRVVGGLTPRLGRPLDDQCPCLPHLIRRSSGTGNWGS